MTNEQINKRIGEIFQEYRISNNLTQEKLAEKLSKSTNTVSRLETGKDGTSKKTDIEIMDLLGIMPNTIYKDLLNNPELKRKLELSEKINNLSDEKVKALMDIIEIINKL